MADRLRRPTMNDVAHSAGVSLKSVSRVINDEVGASSETRARVLDAAHQLGYRRNDAAHALRRSDGRSASIGLVLEDIANPFASALNRAVEEVASAQGSLVLAVSTNSDPDREESQVYRLLARGVDALVIMSCRRDHRFLEPELQRGVPIVFVDRPPRRISCSTVRVANSKGAYDATTHLVAHGHRRIAFLGDRPSLYTADERLRGHLRALRDADIEADPAIQWRDRADNRLAAAALATMLDLPDPPTAVFAGNNLIAIGVLMAIRKRRLHRRIAVVGFDDLDLAEVVDPPLTVIEQDPAGMGRIATEQLFRRLAGEDAVVRDVVIPVRLVQRGSGEIPGPFAGI